MTRIARLLDELSRRGDDGALVHDGAVTTAAGLVARIAAWDARLAAAGDAPGGVVGLRADFTPDSVALLLALLARGDVAALVPPSARRPERLLAEARARSMWTGTGTGDWSREDGPGGPDHPLLTGLRERGGSGIVLFSSGSTGTPKAILHETERFLRKFDAPGKAMRTLAFLLFDHVAGQDTLFYTLAAGGCLVLPASRDPEGIARLIAAARVEVLPASPTFLKLFCLAGVHERHDLSSLRIITYGSEAMPPATLARVNEVFPNARIVQKYGTSELGSPRSRSRDGGSLWMSLKDDEIEAKVVDGILWLRSDTAMLGYLNAPNPIDEAGWWCTGDLVEVDGDWIRILGRESELINVGGEKVYPREVEEAILELDWVADALVRGAPHPITGHIVEAVLNLVAPRDDREVRKAVRAHCRGRLAPFQVPARVLVTDEPLASERHKKRRGAAASG